MGFMEFSFRSLSLPELFVHVCGNMNLTKTHNGPPPGRGRGVKAFDHALELLRVMRWWISLQ